MDARSQQRRSAAPKITKRQLFEGPQCGDTIQATTDGLWPDRAKLHR